MNNFASHRIEQIIVENVKTKVSVKATSKVLFMVLISQARVGLNF